jgi:hypothetical protein
MSDKKTNEIKTDVKQELKKEPMKIFIQYTGNRENYTRYGKLMPKEKTELSSIYGNINIEQRVKDLSNDSEIIIIRE